MPEDTAAPSGTSLRWPLLALLLVLAAAGVGSGMRSLHAMSARHAQAEREAAESEAKLVELLALRESMAARLRVLEAEGARLTQERDALRAQLEARAPATRGLRSAKAAKAAASKVERRKRVAAAGVKKARTVKGGVRVASTAR